MGPSRKEHRVMMIQDLCLSIIRSIIGFITSEEKDMAVKQWPLFCQKTNQLKGLSNRDLEIYVDILEK